MSKAQEISGLAEYIEELHSSYSHVFTAFITSSLFSVFGPAGPLVGLVAWEIIQRKISLITEASEKAVRKKLLKFKPVEKCVNSLSKLFPEKLQDFFKELEKEDPENVIEKFEEYLNELEKKEELKKEIGKELKESIKRLLSGELNDEELLELFETDSEYVAYEYYAILLEILTNKKCLEILGRIGGLEERLDEVKEGLEIAEETKKMVESLGADFKKFEEKVENYFEGLKRELEEMKLLDFGFELLNLKDIVASVPDKSRWREVLDFPEVYAEYDAPREIVSEIEEKVESGESVIILGKAGYGKSVLLKRIAVDLACREFVVVYCKDVVEVEKVSVLNKLFKNLKILGGRVVVILDNVHRKPEVISLAYEYTDFTYVFAAREEELIGDKEEIKLGFKGELEKEARHAYRRLKKFKLERLSKDEVKAFVEKYKELFEKKVYDTEYYCRVSKGEPLVLNLLLTESLTPVEYVDVVEDIRGDEVAKYVALTTALMHIAGFAVDGAFVGKKRPEAFLRRVLDRVGVTEHDTIRDSIERLRGRFIVELEEKGRKVLITRHELLAEMFLKKCDREDCVFCDEDYENVFEEYVVSVLSAVFDVFGKNSDFTVWMLVNLSSLKMPELLVKILEEGVKWVDSEGKLGRIYFDYGNTFYERGFEWWSKAEEYYLKALEIYRKLAEKDPAYKPDYAMTLNNLGNLYSDKGEFDKAEKCYLKALEIYRKLAEKDNTYMYDYAITMIRAGYLYYLKRELNKAKEYLKEALKLSENYGFTNLTEIIKYLLEGLESE